MPVFDGIDNKTLMQDGTTVWQDTNGQYRSRLGWDALRDLGSALCRAVSGFAPIIRRLFAENEVVMMLLEVAEVACGMLLDVTTPLADGDDVPNPDGIKSDVLTSLQTIIDKYGGA